jgi:hypothetical protein
MCKPKLIGLPMTGMADTRYYVKIRCPSCKAIGWIDKEQFEGKVSIVCGCGWHETHDLR